MKLTSIAVVFAMIVAAVFSISSYRISQLEKSSYVDRYYKKALENAASSAASTLKKRAAIYAGGIVAQSEVEPKQVFDTFLKSFAMSIGRESEKDLLDLQKYFPVLAIIEDDGIVLSSYREYESNGDHYSKRLISSKLAFSFEDNGTIYYPKLSGKIGCLYLENGNWVEENGSVESINSNPYREKRFEFLERADAHKEIKNRISQQISELISEEISRHRLETKLGTQSYDFYLPPNTNDLVKSIEAPTILAIMQGLSTDAGISTDCVSLNRLEVSMSDFYAGFVMNGVKYYAKDGDSILQENELIEAFSSQRAAVKAGYYKWNK